MIRTLADTSFKWIDLLAPTAQELNRIASDYAIHEAFIADVLQPEHLPKYEPVGDTSFYILRYYSAKLSSEVDTIQELTNKIAIFQTEKLLITIHRLDVEFINDLKKDFVDRNR